MNMEKLSRKNNFFSSTASKTASRNSLSSKINSLQMNRCSSVEEIETQGFSLEQYNERPLNLFESPGKTQDLEAKLRKLEQKYLIDTENLQNYVNLLRRKLKNSRSSQDLSFKPEKSVYNKLQALASEKNRLEQSLNEAQQDMKRLYQEIKVQSQVISEYKEKFSNTHPENSDKTCKVLENQVKVQDLRVKELEEENFKLKQELQGYKDEVLFLNEQIRFYEDSDIPKEVKKYQNLKKNENLLNNAKVECKEMIHEFVKDLNEKYSDLFLKTQNVESEQGKIHHLFKLIQTKFSNSSMPNGAKVKRELELTKKELEEALRENYDLHETLEHFNLKNNEKYEMVLAENARLKQIIKGAGDRRKYK